MFKKIYLTTIVIGIIFFIGSCDTLPNFEIRGIKLSYGINPINLEDLEKRNFEFLSDDWQEQELSEKAIKQGLNDGNEWDVSLENDKIMISTAIYYNEFRFDLEDGYFLSENRGEFGGNIDFIDNDNIKYTVLECIPIEMFSINSDIYLLEGLSHMTSARGNLYKLNKIDNKWTGDKKIILSGTPYSCTIDKNGDVYIIIQSNSGDGEIIKISVSEKDLKIQSVLKIPYEITFANSMVKKGDILYVGLRGGLSIIDLNKNKIRFYTKK